MRRLLLFLVVVYAAVAAVIGLETADRDLRSAIGPAGVAGLYGLLVVVFGSIAFLSVWIVTLLTKFVYKILVRDAFDAAAVRDQTLLLMVISLGARAVAMVIELLFGTAIGVATLVVPAIAALWVTRSDSTLKGPARLIVHLPFLVYLALDAAVLVLSPVVRA